MVVVKKSENEGDNDATGESQNTYNKKIINGIKECEEGDGQPCVCGALEQCTSALDETEAVHYGK